MERKRHLEEMNKKKQLDGLSYYQKRGIPILIDGEESIPSDWEQIFEVHEDGSFYMGDYILEEGAAEGGKKALREIRFDKVYYR